MRHLRAVLAAVVAALLVAGTVTSPARAASGVPRLDPHNRVVDAFSPWGLKLDLDGTELGSAWVVTVSCDNDTWQDTASFVADGSSQTWVHGGRELPYGGWCEVYVRPQDGGADSPLGGFAVQYVELPPPTPTPAATDFRSSASGFYPTVRDGFQDGLGFDWTPAYFARDFELVVRNAWGSIVLSDTAYWNSWEWNGRDQYGSDVAPGTYTVELRGRQDDGAVGSVGTVTVDVLSDVVEQRVTVSKDGWESAPSASRSCSVVRDVDWDHNTLLDCWGGRFAQATYTFAIPRDARDIAWSMDTRVTSADMCCRGRVSKTAARPSRTTYVVKARVTRWRALDVRGVELSYTANVRR